MVCEEKLHLVKACRDRWRNHLLSHPEDQWMEDYTSSWRDEDRHMVGLIPVAEWNDPEDREFGIPGERQYGYVNEFGTACGNESSSNVFLRAGIVEFLWASCIEFIVALIDDEQFELEHEPGIPLGMIAFRAPSELAPVFANLVEMHGGSLRWDDSTGDQCLFESE